jgi:hypothetical protein
MLNYWQTVYVVLRSNHWQTVDLGFEAQPRNLSSSSPRARYRPHTTSPDLLIIWPLSIRPVWPSLVLCTRSPTPTTILITACHAAPVTCTPWDKQTRFFKWNKDKGKTPEMSQIQIQTSSCQWLITIKPRNWPLNFSIRILKDMDTAINSCAHHDLIHDLWWCTIMSWRIMFNPIVLFLPHL